MNNIKLKLSIVLFIATGSASGVTIDFDTADYAIPAGQIAANANGVDGWESQAFLGFVVPEPGIGSAQALGFGPKYVEPSSATESITRDVNFALTGNATGVHIPASGSFSADFLVNAPVNSSGNDVFGISLYGNAGGETIGFTFDPGNKDAGSGGDLGVGGISNIYYGSKYTFSVSFSGATAQLRGGSGAFQTYAATITDALGGGTQTISGTLSSTAISSIGLTYALADPSAALSTASDSYLLVDNISFSATIPEPSVSLLSLFGAGLLILRRKR